MLFIGTPSVTLPLSAEEMYRHGEMIFANVCVCARARVVSFGSENTKSVHGFAVNAPSTRVTEGVPINNTLSIDRHGRRQLRRTAFAYSPILP